MNRNLFLSILFLIIFAMSYVWADNDDVFNYPLTQQNMSTFNAACLRLAERPIIKGNFSQEKYLSRFNRSLVSSGKFIIAAEYGMVWETDNPFPSTMILGNDFMMQSRPGGQTSVMSAQGNETFLQMSGILSSVFSGNSRGLLENFEVFFFESASNWSIGLLPKDSMIASFASRIIMTGDFSSGGSAAIRSIRIFEQSGDVITYTLFNHNYPAELNENEKAFFRQ